MTPPTEPTGLREALKADDPGWWERRLGSRNGSNAGMAEFVVGVLRAALSSGPEPVASEGFIGHKPLSNGKCEHRWRNRTTHIVTCRYADGWHAGQVAALSSGPEPDVERESFIAGSRAIYGKLASPGPEPVAGLDVEELATILEGVDTRWTTHRTARYIIAALSKASEPGEGS